MGGKRQRRRRRTEGGSEGEREKLNERDRANLKGANTTKLLNYQASGATTRLTSLLFSTYGCLSFLLF